MGLQRKCEEAFIELNSKRSGEEAKERARDWEDRIKQLENEKIEMKRMNNKLVTENKDLRSKLEEDRSMNDKIEIDKLQEIIEEKDLEYLQLKSEYETEISINKQVLENINSKFIKLTSKVVQSKQKDACLAQELMEQLEDINMESKEMTNLTIISNELNKTLSQMTEGDEVSASYMNEEGALALDSRRNSQILELNNAAPTPHSYLDSGSQLIGVDNGGDVGDMGDMGEDGDDQVDVLQGVAALKSIEDSDEDIPLNYGAAGNKMDIDTHFNVDLDHNVK